ncbi:epimerase family protein SDR39U1 [Neodiprion virginianus]|uniref:epimerase family protein SDR39U1 n=1 Tax=Neodiprion virginianus TaxID=2961670 RepID=UPI001EE754D9|nr:epimerase family protein SDR39U1 [Neodiprion virginianus]
MTVNHIVIGGGTGFIGTALVNAFKQRGFCPIIISRMPGPFRMSWHDLERDGLPKNTTAVVNVAGQNILDPTQRWTPGFKQNIWNSRVETTKLLARAVTACPPKVFVTISGVAYYPPDKKEYNEESICNKYDFLSELCHEWEDAAKLPKDLNVRQAIIRSGVVLGRTGGMIKQIFIPFYVGLGGPIGSGKQPMPWIHIDDISNIFVNVVENDNVSGIFNGVAPQVVTNKEFTDAFASALWRPAKIPVPEFALALAFNRERAKIMTEGQKVIPKRVLESGFKYKYPTIDLACNDIAKW